MSQIAQRLTGYNEGKFREYEFRSVPSRRHVVITKGCPPRQNVRFANDMIVGNDDLRRERMQLSRPLTDLLRP